MIISTCDVNNVYSICNIYKNYVAYFKLKFLLISFLCYFAAPSLATTLKKPFKKVHQLFSADLPAKDNNRCVRSTQS